MNPQVLISGIALSPTEILHAPFLGPLVKGMPIEYATLHGSVKFLHNDRIPECNYYVYNAMCFIRLE